MGQRCRFFRVPDDCVLLFDPNPDNVAEVIRCAPCSGVADTRWSRVTLPAPRGLTGLAGRAHARWF